MATPIDISDTISPLPELHRRSMLAMCAIGMLSLIATSSLWLHITYNLWFGRRSSAAGPNSSSSSSNNASNNKNNNKNNQANSLDTTNAGGIDLSLGLSENNYRRAKGSNNLAPRTTIINMEETDHEHDGEKVAHEKQSWSRERQPPNPLLILIYNLLFADMSLAATYTANIVWLRDDGITVGTTTCRAQGWIVSFGCLATSGFLFTIACYTYLSIVHGYKPSSRTVLVNILVLWLLITVVNCLGPLVKMNSFEPYYARQNLWCWISEKHVVWRLSVYVWGFFCFAATAVLYGRTFWSLYKEGRSSRVMPQNNLPSGHVPAFLVYPFLYLFCATPLTIGSIIRPLERSTTFMAFTGSILAMSGLLDAALWSSTIIFSDSQDMANTGLNQFAFMRTPEGRSLGNMIWVQGGAYEPRIKQGSGWWQLRGSDRDRASNISRQSLRRHAGGMNEHGIQMDVVTTVVIEEDVDNSRSSGGPKYSSDKGREQDAQSFRL